jgi:hypothetical protein
MGTSPAPIATTAWSEDALTPHIMMIKVLLFHIESEGVLGAGHVLLDLVEYSLRVDLVFARSASRSALTMTGAISEILAFSHAARASSLGVSTSSQARRCSYISSTYNKRR